MRVKMTPDNNWGPAACSLLAERQSVFVFLAERREAVSDQSGRWIGHLQLSVSTGQQTAAPPCSRQVQGERVQATRHLRTPVSTYARCARSIC